MADITLIQQAENSSNETTSCSLTLENCTVGNTLILAYAIRGNGNNPTLTDGWEKIGGGNVDADYGNTYHKLYFAKKKIENTTETITLTQTTTGRIYLVCGEFSGNFNVVMRDDMANIGSGDFKVTANKKNTTDVILYGVTSSYYTTGRLQKCEPNDLTKLQGSDTAERLTCWFDNGNGAVSHTFETAKDTGTNYISIVECVQLIPKKPKYLIRNNDIVYTVQNDSLVEVVGGLNAQLFLDNGVDEIPSGTLLMTLSNPEVLCWTDSDKVPTLKATVQGVPTGAHAVISDHIQVDHPSIYGISSVVSTASDGATFLLSFDGGAWMKYNDGTWSASDVGMTAAELMAIPSNAWISVINSAQYMQLKATLEGVETVTQVVFNYNNESPTS